MQDNLVTPIYQTTVHECLQADKIQAFNYARSENPTVKALENALCELESSKGALCFSSGMAAITTTLLSLLRTGDHIICDNQLYGGTTRLIKQLAEQFHIKISWVDTAKISEIEVHINNNTRIIFSETPTNPTLKTVDISAIAKLAKHYQLVSIVDNTMLTPVLQNPLDHGIDIVVYSTSKYIDGHNAAMGGAITSHNETWLSHIQWMRNATGTIQTPWHAWLTLQGMKTLSMRMTQHQANAQQVAAFLKTIATVDKVLYPGVGGVVSFELNPDLRTPFEFMHALTLCKIAGSFGSTTSLISHPASMIDPASYRDDTGIVLPSHQLLRLSVGLESAALVIEDLYRAATDCLKR